MSTEHQSSEPARAPARPFRIGNAFDVLARAGLSLSFIQSRLVPAWWNDELDGQPEAMAQLAKHMGSLVGVPGEDIINGTVKGGAFVVNVARLPDWCGARLASGAPCPARAVVNPRSKRRVRCRRHGGASTGARTAEGKMRQSVANRERMERVWERSREATP